MWPCFGACPTSQRMAANQPARGSSDIAAAPLPTRVPCRGDHTRTLQKLGELPFVPTERFRLQLCASGGRGGEPRRRAWHSSVANPGARCPALQNSLRQLQWHFFARALMYAPHPLPCRRGLPAPSCRRPLARGPAGRGVGAGGGRQARAAANPGGLRLCCAQPDIAVGLPAAKPAASVGGMRQQLADGPAKLAPSQPSRPLDKLKACASKRRALLCPACPVYANRLV